MVLPGNDRTGTEERRKIFGKNAVIPGDALFVGLYITAMGIMMKKMWNVVQ